MGFSLPPIGLLLDSLLPLDTQLTPFPWRFERGIDDPSSADRCDQMPPLPDLFPEHIATALDNSFYASLFLENRTSFSASTSSDERPAKSPKTSDWSSPNAVRQKVLSFSGGDSAAITPDDQVLGFSIPMGERSRSGRRSPSRLQDHTTAERRRREKLSRGFIALSAMVPGLKKLDKASVLGGAVGYVKKLKERVKILEGQAAMRTVESAEGDFERPAMAPVLPEVSAEVSEGRVLVRIHCERRRGALAKIVGEMENLHLSILNASAVPFAGSYFHITVTAQMEFSITAIELVKHLKIILQAAH